MHVAADHRLQLVGGALGDDVAGVDHADALGEAVGLLHVLRGEHDRGAFALELGDHVPQAHAAAGVEPGGGLVEEQDGRRHHQAGAEVETPAHPAGVRLQRAVGRVVELEDAEQPRRPFLRRLAGHAPEPSDEHEVLAAGEIVVDRGELAGQADHRPDELGLLHHVEATDGGATAVEGQERGEDPDGRGLAGAVRPEQAGEHPLFHHEVRRRRVR